VPRWDPEAEARLRDAALQLCVEHGYDNVTVTQITERAGLTRRTFSRYFTDKRDVLFAGSERLPGAVAEIIRAVDPGLPPFAVLLVAFEQVGKLLAEFLPNAAQRRAVIESSPELLERERTKMAAITVAATTALRDRGTPEPDATLLARVGVALFQTTFAHWADHPTDTDYPALVRETAAKLAADLSAG
jgi:AcrR family transcriptional regulator